MSSRKISRRSFLIGGTGVLAAGAAVGWRGRNRLRSIYYTTREDLLRPELISNSFDQLDSSASYDVCIIGSGPAGAILGRDLAQQGISTIILESGISGGNPQQMANLRQLEKYENIGEIDYPVAATRFRGLGGTSVMWTGRCARLHPIDFEENAYTPADNPWPISYADFEPYYTQAEKTLRVYGGNLSDSHAPRSEPLPFPSQIDLTVLNGLTNQVGITVDESPTSASNWLKDQPLRVATDVLPEFTQFPSATLVSGATAVRLIADSSGHVDGVEVRSLTQESKVVSATHYVVACGGIESARLLKLSTSETSPNGLGNDHDLVGRFFMEHPSTILRGQIPAQNVSPASYLIGRSHQFYDQLKQEGLGSAILIFYWENNNPSQLRIGATLEMSPAANNRVTLSDDLNLYGNQSARLSASFTPEDNATFDRINTMIRDIYAELGGSNVEVDQALHWSHHHMGTCRMGDNPEASVVDRNLRVHSTPNLYVVGSSNFVTGGASHPTLAITALSHRLAEHLTTQLNRSAQVPQPSRAIV